MDYIFTFLVYLIEILQKRYKGLFIVEAMSPSGNGLRNTSQRKYLAKEKRVTSLYVMKLRLRLVGSQYISGSGLQSIEPKHRQINTSD